MSSSGNLNSLVKRINKIFGTDLVEDWSIDWYDIFRRFTVSEEFIEEFWKDLDWDYLSFFQPLSERLIIKYAGLVNWEWMSANQILSEEFIEKFEDKVYWGWISSNQKLSEEFIMKYKDKVDWRDISRYQVLSWKFMKEYKSYLDWENISTYQFNIEEEDYHELFKSLLKKNLLYQTKKSGKDWFVGYTKKSRFNRYKFIIDRENTIYSDFNVKSMIYLKDLNILDTILGRNKIKMIRDIKMV